MKHALKATAVGIAAAAALFTFCHRSNPTVARAGGTVISLADLETDLLQTSAETSLSQISYEAARSRLTDLIRKELVYQAALHDGFDRKDHIRTVLEENHEAFLLDLLFTKAVLNRVIKESDIRDFYTLSGHVVLSKNIFFRFPPMADAAQRDSVKAVADSVYALIAAGANYDDMVRRFSQDPVSREKGGNIGRLSWTRPDDPITVAAFQLKKGEVGKPVFTRMGCNILKVTDIQPNEQREPYKTARLRIMTILQQAKRTDINETAREYQEKLLKQYKVAYDDSLISATAAKMTAYGSTAGAITEGLKRERDAVLDLPLATYTFGTFPVRRLIGKITGYGPKSRFSVPDGTALKSYVSRWLLPVLLVQNAKDRGLDRDRDLVAKFHRFSRDFIVDKYREEVIIGSTDFTDAEIAAFYEKNKETKYREPETRQVREIHVSDLETAKALHARLKQGAAMAPLAEQYTERRGYDQRKGLLGYIKQQSWGEIGQQAFRMKIGDISEPIPLSNSSGYSIITVLAVQPGHYLDMQRNRARIQSDMLNDRIHTRTNNWYADQEARTGTVINEEVLADVFAKQPQGT
ncbi:peptidylprolyl isomerase [bacterium]|nr:peptidylprolyl isomerase [bacterium]